MKFPKETAKQQLIKHLPARRYIPRSKLKVLSPNAVHQADLLFLRHDKLPCGRKVYKSTLSVVDVTSRYKEVEPLTSKEYADVVKVFQTIYKHSPLAWPHMLQVDPSRDFMGSVTKEMDNHKTYICRARAEI